MNKYIFLCFIRCIPYKFIFLESLISLIFIESLILAQDERWRRA